MEVIQKMKHKKIVQILSIFLLLCGLLCSSALASGGKMPSGGSSSGSGSSSSGGSSNVSAVVEQTWTAAASQIKNVVDKVVFPALDMILAIAFFGKLAMSYFDYRKHGQFEWTGPVILFACLVFTLTAPLYIWSIVGL